MNGILSGFTRKYIFRKNYLPDSAEAPRLAVGMDLNWHWSVKGDNLYVDIAKNFEKLLADYLPIYSVEKNFSIDQQPMWDMKEKDENVPGESHSNDDDHGTSSPTSWRTEYLAYYAPAHGRDASTYGIHLIKRGIAKLASEVHQLCPNEPIEIIQLASVYMLFAHEICHAWIEDICCLLDFNNGSKKAKQYRIYSITSKKYNNYIAMEEAICNTASYGFLHKFLHCELTINNIPAFNPENIMKAFEQWMRKQPKGYRDFEPITDVPYQSDIFVRNILRLIVRVYRFDPWSNPELFEIVGELFGCHCHLAPDGQFIINFKENSGFFSLWGDEPPLHVEY